MRDNESLFFPLKSRFLESSYLLLRFIVFYSMSTDFAFFFGKKGVTLGVIFGVKNIDFTGFPRFFYSFFLMTNGVKRV